MPKYLKWQQLRLENDFVIREQVDQKNLKSENGTRQIAIFLSIELGVFRSGGVVVRKELRKCLRGNSNLALEP